MKKLLAKIRNKKLKGNVSLLVIFILLASSVISLLSINQIQRLMTYGNMTSNYFRAFYIAKAGTELGLTEVYYREAGFEHSVASGNSIVTENLIGIYTGFNPYFNMNISGNFQYLTDDVRYTNECSGGNKITLGSGEGIMLSLFTDTTDDFVNIFTGTTENNIIKLENDDIENLGMEELNRRGSGPNKYFTFGLFDYDDDGNMNNIFVETGNAGSLSNFLDHIDDLNGTRKYLTIKNPGTGDEVAEFCITMENKLIPYSNFLITVFGHYGDMEVGIQSVVKKGVPDWTLNVLDEPSGSN